MVAAEKAPAALLVAALVPDEPVPELMLAALEPAVPLPALVPEIEAPFVGVPGTLLVPDTPAANPLPEPLAVPAGP